MNTVESRNNAGRSIHRHIIDLPVLDHRGNTHVALCRGFTGWRPHSTQGIPLVARIFHNTTTIRRFFKTRVQITHNLSWWLSLHLTPRSIDGAAGYAVREGCRFEKYRNPETAERFRWVKCGLLTTSCTQSRTPRTSSGLIAARSEFIPKLSPDVTRPRMAIAVTWSGVPETRYRWNNCNIKIISHMIGDNTFFIQRAPTTETSLWRAEEPCQAGFSLKSTPVASANEQLTGTRNCGPLS